ncbi:MAG TPA: choice-of-anchor tandem repeat GloVer-containing protein [Rhizomicrobium sp.]
MLYTFTNGSDGGLPCCSSLVLDGKGDLYGTTVSLSNCCNSGAVFELAPGGNESVLYSFPNGSGGSEPTALVMDKAGNLWGTTIAGGISGGVIFKILTSKDKEKLIHTFEGSPDDGCAPEGAMVVDNSGDFFGTTFGCGKHGFGTVFELMPNGTESPLYSFRGGRDGLYPVAGLIIDSQGNLYGTTQYGGVIGPCSDGFGGCGTIFRLAPDGTKTELYKFKGPPGDGYRPAGNVIMDASGNLYGTTSWGGRAGCFADEGCGLVFELSSNRTETVLHFFNGEKRDGSNPSAGLIADSAGNLYGTTEFGGSSNNCNGANGCGTVFEMAPDGTETILHKFKEATDGANPMGGLVADSSGNLYGTATYGGAFGYGTVFEITP